MKRIATILAALALTTMLMSSCNANPETTTMYTPAQIAQAIISAQENIAVLQPLLPDDEYFTDYLLHIYQLNADAIEDGAIYYADGMRADEIAVLLLADSSDTADISAALVEYKERRTDAFSGYAPIQAAILANSVVVTHGNYVALLICEEPQKAQAVFIECFSGNPPIISGDTRPLPPDGDIASDSPREEAEDNKPLTTDNSAGNGEANSTETGNGEPGSGASNNGEPGNGETAKDGTANGKTGEEESKKPETVDGGPKSDTPGSTAPPNGQTAEREDIYDPASILHAWHSGDKTGLTYINRSILEACIEIIGAVINENMSEYEKELAIHDWIIDWVSYDEEANSNSPNAAPDPNNNNPYGAIFKRKAICSGYTSTFQLFMDLLGIECITIEGIYSATGQEHAWNMVRIDGEWYCVDVTWNDPIGGSGYSRYIYFNVTSKFMRDTNHQWDESATPVADAGKLFFD